MTEVLEPRDVFAECQPVLEVRDVQAAIDWYTDKLDFSLEFAVGQPPTYACVGRSFSGQGAAAALRFVAWYRDREEPNWSGWLAIYVGQQIDALYQHCQTKGITISRPIANHEYGMREFEIRDCDGHYLRFGCVIEH